MQHKNLKNLWRLSVLILTLISILFAYMLFNTDHKFAFAVEAEGNKKFGITLEPSDRLFDVANMAPGDHIEKQIVVKNIGKLGFTYYLSAVLEKGDKLFDVFTISIKEKAGRVFYQGKLKELKNLHLGALESSEEEAFIIDVLFPAESGNEFQGEQISVSFLFEATERQTDEEDDHSDSHEEIRLGGENRIETATKVSKQGWPNGAPAAVLTREDDFADALAGTPLAYKLDIPILLTNKDHLTPKTMEELLRLKSKTVYILGLEGAVSREIEDALNHSGFEIIRLGGADRFGTAEEIARFIGVQKRVVIANGYSFADALSISPWAARKGVPILFTQQNLLPKSTLAILDGFSIQDVIVVGGEGVIGKEVSSQFKNASYYAGKDRYGTNAKIFSELGNDISSVFITTGLDFPDALTGSVLAAKSNSMILLLDDNFGNPEVLKFLESKKGRLIISHIIGGFGAVPESLIERVKNIIGN